MYKIHFWVDNKNIISFPSWFTSKILFYESITSYFLFNGNFLICHGLLYIRFPSGKEAQNMKNQSCLEYIQPIGKIWKNSNNIDQWKCISHIINIFPTQYLISAQHSPDRKIYILSAKTAWYEEARRSCFSAHPSVFRSPRFEWLDMKLW